MYFNLHMLLRVLRKCGPTSFLMNFTQFVLEIKIHTDSTLTKAEISLKINFDIVTSDFLTPFYIFHFFIWLRSCFSLVRTHLK